MRSEESFPPSPAGRMSLLSFRDYPPQRPFTMVSTQALPSYHSSSAGKAFPESNGAAILSALRNLQEKMKKLELDKHEAQLNLRVLGRDTSQSVTQTERITQRDFSHQTKASEERQDKTNSNQALMTQLKAAESRCLNLERQLDHMRKMLQAAKMDRTSLLNQQMSIEKEKSAYHQNNAVFEQARLDKMERLEQEYRRLMQAQTTTELKIHDLETKLHDEQHKNKIMQAKAKLLQTGLETNRVLLQSVSPQLSFQPSRPKKKTRLKKSYQGQLANTQRNYGLSVIDVPFVAGKSVGSSHSVRANVQSMLSLLKHQPHLWNGQILTHRPDHAGMDSRCHSGTSSPFNSSCEEELLDLLQALQEELRLMNLEQHELVRELEKSMSTHDRRALQREQEQLLLKMANKGEQIRKLHKHKAWIKKLRKEASSRLGKVKEGREYRSSVYNRGQHGGTVKAGAGEKRKKNLKLLRDLKALQTSLQI